MLSFYHDFHSSSLITHYILSGLETEQAYHYDGRDERCHFNRSEVRVTIDSAVTLPTDEAKIAEFLVKKGPVSVGINANAMQFYFGGVSHPWSFLCSKSGIDHGVLIVGLGENLCILIPYSYYLPRC